MFRKLKVVVVGVVLGLVAFWAVMPGPQLSQEELMVQSQAMDSKSGQGLISRLIQLSTGQTPDELHVNGGVAYPTENNIENQGGHRLAAKLMTDRLGFLPTQLAGIANEGLEAATNKAVTGQWFPNGGPAESMRDLGANWRGSMDSLGAGAGQLRVALPTSVQALLASLGTTSPR